MRKREAFVSALLLLTPVATRAAPAAGVTAAGPWMRYLLPNLPAAGYLTVTNDGVGPVVLTGAASPACGMLMLHRSQDVSGMAMMTNVPAVTIPAGGSLDLAPGGYHLMCMQPRMKVGDQIPMALMFQGGARVNTTMRVYGANGAP